MGTKTWKYKIRPLLDLGDCLGVSLSDGSVALIDYEDRTIAEGWNWSAYHGRHGIYAHRGDGKRTIRLHAEIAGPRCDHKNGNTLDNRRSNLRKATQAENCQNRKRASNNTSGYKGVSFRSDRGTWLASIRPNGRLIKIGTFATKEEAARAYDRAAIEHFGKFAVLNFRPEASDDFAKSLDVAYDHIRNRVAAGGERGWMDGEK